MSGKPEKIFLRKLTHFDMLCSVWGKKRVRDTDIEYIRADLAKPSEWISLAPSLDKLQKDIGEWSDKTFGQSDRLDGVIAHLKKEVDELADNPIDAMEYADCFMLLIDAARIAGLDADKLKFFCNQKLKVNKKRKWGEPDENGVIEHIKPSPPDKE